jgi:hypothetical protein
LNTKSIGAGAVANLQLNISAGAAAGPIPVAITGIFASDASANPVDIIGSGGSVTVLAPADTTPPTISGVSSSGLTSTGATITWTTNEPADTQVEYGTTTGYGSSTTLNTAMVTSHSQALSGLTVGTLYHYRVKSRDAAGNLAISGDYTFTTTAETDATSPVISDVESSRITSSGATITWTTDEESDTQVEYGTSASYGSTTDLNTAMITSHSQSLGGLTAGTPYHYRVKSRDAAGNLATSGDYTFTTTEDLDLTFALPRFAAGSSAEETFMGIALANLDSAPAEVTFTAVATNGNLVGGPEIVNPSVYELSPGSQLPIHDLTIFGNGLNLSNPNGWIKLQTTTREIGGFFMIFDGDMSFLDGASLPDRQLTGFVFTEVQTNGSTKINLVNDNPEEASVTIDLMSAEGGVRRSQSRVISPNGALAVGLYEDLFPGVSAYATDYVRVTATQGVQPFQVLQPKQGDISILAGQDTAVGATMLYAPQYVLGGQYRTDLSVINLDSRAGVVQFRFVGEDGNQIGPSRLIEIQAHGKLYIDDQAFFVEPEPGVMTIGYVEITGVGIRITGSTVFEDINGRSFISALELIHRLQNSVVFSHVASNDLFFTGIAILNPSLYDASVTLELHAADGRLVETVSRVIPAGQRISRLMTEYFGSLRGRDQTSGYLRITSSRPTASFALFGTKNLSVLSAIPPQVVK